MAFFYQREIENFVAFGGHHCHKFLFTLYAHVEEQRKEWVYKENSVIIYFSIAQVNKERKSRSLYA